MNPFRRPRERLPGWSPEEKQKLSSPHASHRLENVRVPNYAHQALISSRLSTTPAAQCSCGSDSPARNTVLFPQQLGTTLAPRGRAEWVPCRRGLDAARAAVFGSL